MIFPVAITAMPKSGSEYIGHILHTISGRRRVSSDIGPVPWRTAREDALEAIGSCMAMTRGHFCGEERTLERLAAARIGRLAVHVRDPRQTTLSWAHFMGEHKDFEFSRLTYDPPLPPDFQSWDLDKRVDWSIRKFLPGQIWWIRTWLAAGERLNIHWSTFEKMVEGYVDFFEDLAAFFLIRSDRAAIERLSCECKLNFRRGQVDEWRTTPLAGELARALPDDLAERFGWN